MHDEPRDKRRIGQGRPAARTLPRVAFFAAVLRSAGFRSAGPLLAGLAVFACLAPPPPIVAPTMYGEVRAESAEKAGEFAELLEDLVPRVRALLPGSQERGINVWVQDKLRVYKFSERSKSVRGFTLLRGEFDAKRIHLTEDGQSSWYLAHELVHALIGPDWKALPGVLEEGLADVVAEKLNPEYGTHIRAHRLLNASAVTGGLEVVVSYKWPDSEKSIERWERVRTSKCVQAVDPIDHRVIERVLESTRSRLHREYPELPEGLYGFAWLVVHRIVERHGLEGFHRLCLEASSEGLDIVPVSRLMAAAEIDLGHLNPTFLYECFGTAELRTAANLQPELFAEVALDALRPFRGSLSAMGLLRKVEPTLVSKEGGELRFGFIRPVLNYVTSHW